MKTYLFFAMTLVFSIVITSCRPVTTESPNMFEYPTASGLTPASLDVIVGNEEPMITIDNNWYSYQNDELGIFLYYPPSWQAITSNDVSGVGLYPPESDPSVPTPMIKIEWLDVSYSDQPLINTESSINSIEISGILGRQYQDSKFVVPTQSQYIELPYRNGILFFITTIGPSVYLGSQLDEILKTLTLNESGLSSAATEAPVITEAPIATEAPAATEAPVNASQPTQAQISNEIYFAALRKTPGYSNKNNDIDLLANVPAGATVQILGGPEQADGLNWWNVSWNGITGWMADHTGSGKTIMIFLQ